MTGIWILGHWFHYNYLFLPPLAWNVEDTAFLKSGYRDIGPPGAGPYPQVQQNHGHMVTIKDAATIDTNTRSCPPESRKLDFCVCNVMANSLNMHEF